MAALSLIDDIRAASRLMVRELGFMDATVAASDYPPSAVHTILEIGIRGPLTSGELGDFLRLEKSSVDLVCRSRLCQSTCVYCARLGSWNLRWTHSAVSTG